VGKLTCKSGSAKILRFFIREGIAIAQSPLPHHLLDAHQFETLHI